VIQTKPYEFMTQHTPQREWIEGRGVLMWLATFFIEAGAAAFLVASIFNSLWGMFVGIVICAVLGGGLHLVYLGRPFRFWRILLSSGWKTSWLSRGLWFVSVFLVLGVIYLVLAKWASAIPALLIAADVFAFCTIIYLGFVMSYINGIALWNSALLPVLILVVSIWGGLGISVFTLLATGAEAATAELWSRIFLLSFIFIVFLYLFGARYRGVAGNLSVREIIRGTWAPLFWVAVVILGMVLPIIVGGLGWLLFEVPTILLYAVIIFELLADLSLRYCLLRCAFYAPLIPSSSYAT
jgi:formate-dependent nitrite reductase membrane component NrfD